MSKKNKLDFSPKTKRTLRQRVAGYCSNPNCRVSTTGPHTVPGKANTVGEAAHIYGKKQGAARHDPALSPEEIRHLRNGIWLCGKCHTLVDSDEDQFPARRLREWKENAERYAAAELVVGSNSNITRGVSADTLDLLGESFRELARRRRDTNGDEEGTQATIQIDSEERFLEVTEQLSKQLSRNGTTEIPPQNLRNAEKHLRTAEERRTIGILSSSPVPLGVAEYKQLFPELEWESHIENLADLGLVVLGERNLLKVPREVQDRFVETAENLGKYDEEWLDVLIPLQSYYDMAILLALKQFELDRGSSAYQTIIYGAQNVEPGYWNAIYRDALKKIHEHEFEQFSDDLKAQTLNGLGLCAVHDQEPSKAIHWFIREKELAIKGNLDWAYDEALINLGVAYFRAGAIEEAEACYLEALERAKETKNTTAESRLLHNLADIVMRRNPTKAIRLLEDSIELKSDLGDDVGVISSKLMMGLAHVESGNTEPSVEIFKEVAETAEENNLDRLRTLALINQASSLFHLGYFGQAQTLYANAEEIARRFGYPREIRLVLQGKAKTLTELENYEDAKENFRELLEIAVEQENVLNEIIAKHDIGICVRELGDAKQARQYWWKLALQRAREVEQSEWIFRCRLANALSWEDSSGRHKALEKLRRYANEEERRNEFLAAAKLWNAYVIQAEGTVEASKLRTAVEKVSNLLEKEELRTQESLELHRDQFIRYRQAGELQKAFEELQDAEDLVGKEPSVEAVRIIEEQAITLQHLGRLAEAEAQHRRALRMAEELGDNGLMETSLHNLGELKRKMHQPEAALDFFRREEKSARNRGDNESALLAMNHRAITLRDTSRVEEAMELLDEIETDAKQGGHDRELAIALENKAVIFLRDYDDVDQAIELLNRGVQLSEGDVDVHVRTSVSLARAYRIKGETEAALKTLKVVDHLKSFGYEHLAALERAEIHMAMGAWLDAAEACREATEAVSWEGDRAERAVAYLQQYYALMKAGHRTDALTAKEAAYDVVVTATEEAIARAEQLQIEIELDELDAVEEQWEQFDALTSSEDAPDSLSEVEYGVLLSLGAYLWEKSSHRPDACKCFVKAAINALFRYDLAQLFEPGIRWMKCLYKLACEEGGEGVEELQTNVLSWWNAQEADAPDRLTDFVLWPFRGAIRLQEIAPNEAPEKEHLDDVVQNVAVPSLEGVLAVDEE